MAMFMRFGLTLLCISVNLLVACEVNRATQVNTTLTPTANKQEAMQPEESPAKAESAGGDKSAKPVSGASVSFDREHIDLGTLEEGIEVSCKFTITNDGTEPLQVLKTYASCGCTTPSLKKKLLKPKETAVLDVVIDTSMKQGKITKTVDVSTNDIRRPVVSLAISMMVKDRHKGLSDNEKAKILTDEKCMGCHVAQGVGTFGKELYEADCAMCHGKNAEGEVGPCLTFGDYDNADYRKHIRDVIAHGSKVHRSMPGFEETSGGPLSIEQVDSLVVFLAKLTRDKK